MPKDKHVRRGGAAYAQAFSALLPFGPAWPRESFTVLMRVVYGLAQIFGYVDSRSADLLERESDPRRTIELLPEWERAFGLPDKCVAEPLGITARQTALVERMTTEGGQSREFFIALAASIGYGITISEYRPFMVGIDRVGDNRPVISPGVYGEYPYILGQPENRFYWTVHVATARLTWFRVTDGQTGIDPHLRIGLATDLECLLRRYKPAVTDILFDYSGLQTGGSMAGTP